MEIARLLAATCIKLKSRYAAKIRPYLEKIKIKALLPHSEKFSSSTGIVKAVDDEKHSGTCRKHAVAWQANNSPLLTYFLRTIVKPICNVSEVHVRYICEVFHRFVDYRPRKT